jgi:arabinan endo-1,5-alpha-L-arabinosidase
MRFHRAPHTEHACRRCCRAFAMEIFCGRHVSPLVSAVIASRAAHPTGPFTRRGDADGTGRDLLLAQRGSGSAIAAPGHNCIVVDDAGNDWIVYHGYVGGNLNGPRALQLDRVYWSAPNGSTSPVGIWPAVLDGAPSTTPQAVPVINSAASAVRA